MVKRLPFGIKSLLHKIGIHDYMDTSSMACGNVAEISKLHDFQKYNYRMCYSCHREMPHSRHFFNLGIREKNAVEHKNLPINYLLCSKK